MKAIHLGWAARTLALVGFAVTATPSGKGQIVYSNGFEGGAAGPEWSSGSVSITPRGARRFLGRFGSQTVTLSLTNLPPHSLVTVNFDLYVIQSWDGNDPSFGPDVWDLRVVGERSVTHTTFSNTTNGTEPQAFPGIYGLDSFAGLTGSVEAGTLGYTAISAFPGTTDSVYHMSPSFAHEAGSIAVAFAGAPFEQIDNESWGIDNVVVALSAPAGGVIEFVAPVFYVDEGVGTANVTVKRTGAVDSAVSVSFTMGTGLATADVDYTPNYGTLTFAAGETEKSFPVRIFDDATAEVRDETVPMTLANPTGGAAVGSPSAILTIIDNDTADVHFEKSVVAPIPYEIGDSAGAAWGDYDGDGKMDLFVPQSGNRKGLLYHNNGGGSFTKITDGVLVNDIADAWGAAWADYDNDGDLDLIVSRTGGNALYRNDGNGVFTKVTDGAIANTIVDSIGCAWGDYDNDGNVDLFITSAVAPNLLFHNNGDGTFTRVTTGAIVTEIGASLSCAWADYDNDGYLDLFVGNSGGHPNFLYHNNRNGTFSKVTSGPFATDISESYNCAWGDYNNDGFLDLFVSNFGKANFLYRNNGNGTFTKIVGGAIVTDIEYSLACGWADIDNDGDLDLFVSNFGATSSLYINNGNGTFTKKPASELAKDYNPSGGLAWGDFDGDGDMDLMIAKYYQQANALYVNHGSTNSYFKVRLLGTLSNGSAIGARVRIKTRVSGADVWQLREISGGVGSAQEGMEANFGIGGATNVDVVEITWPSGVKQSWTNLQVNQKLSVAEAPNIGATLPAGVLTINAKTGARIVIEKSSDLINWTLSTVTNAPSSDFTVTDPTASATGSRYYRASYSR